MDIIELFNSISAAINQLKGKDILGISTALVALIRAYRLIPGAPWPGAEKAWIVPFATFWVGYVASVLTGALGFQMGWGEAFVGGLAVATNAAGVHALTKATGQAVLAPVQPDEPQPLWKKALGVFVPSPKR